MQKEIAENDIYIPLLENRSRFLILYGGGGSGKSVFAAHKVILRTVGESPHRFLALRKVGETVKDSIFAELQAAVDDLGLSDEFTINKTDRTLRHTITGNEILCKGLDEPKKIKSIKGITGMWLEEATDFDEDDLDQLNIRIRGEKANYIQLILSFNPVDENHWLKKRFFDKKDPDSTVCHSTYKDNYFLSDVDRDQLEKLKERNKLYYDVYCLGKWGVTIKTNKFFYAFSNTKHIIPSYNPNPAIPIIVSFDFNINPMTAIVGQCPEDGVGVIFDELRINEGSVEEMCQVVKAKYNDWMFNLLVTGDATGRNREKARRGNVNMYTVIQEEFQLRDTELLVKTVNPENKDAQVLCNSVLMHAGFSITANCTETIDDMTYASVKLSPTGRVEIVKTEDQGRHFCDNAKYMIDVMWPEFVKKPKHHR